MSIKILKKLNDNLPDFIKKPIGKIIRYKLIKNKDFLETYNLCIRKEEKTEKEIFNTLKSQLIYAYKNTEYYKEKFDSVGFNPYKMKNLEEISCIPYTTKKDVFNNYEKMLSKEKIDYYKTFTGGSTGEALPIILDKSSIYKEKAFIYSAWNEIGYEYKNDKIATFRGLSFNGKVSKLNPLYNEIILNPFMLSKENLEEYIMKIEKFGANYLHGYQSSIFYLAKLMKKYNKKFNNKIKGIFFISENVYKDQTIFIESFFRCKTLSFYGHSERAVFAKQSKKGYLFDQNYGYTELDQKNNEIICTGFLNKKLPLIRYKTDDVAYKLNDNTYEILGHHNSEVLIGANGEEISGAAINFHEKVFEKYEGYQFVQKELGKAILNIKTSETIDENVFEEIKNIVNKKLKDVVEVKIKIVNEFELSKKGKYSKIISNI